MKLATLLFSAALWAAPTVCPPQLAGANAVDQACVGLGQRIFAMPGTSGTVWFENLWGGGDKDFNDLAAAFQINASGTVATFTWLGSNASRDGILFHGTLPLFSNAFHPVSVPVPVESGSEIVLSLYVLDGGIGHIWVTGYGPRNVDGEIHAWVEQSGVVAPEPPSMSIMIGGMGLLLVLAVARRRK